MRKVMMFFVIIFCVQNSHADSTDFFPMSVGNIYIYSVFSHDGSGYFDTTYLRKMTIQKDTIIFGKKYFYIDYVSKFYGWFRVDTATGSLYVFEQTNNCSNYFYENLVDSLSAGSGTYLSGCPNTEYIQITCLEDNSTLFSYNVRRKKFSYSYNSGGASFGRQTYYSENFGMSKLVNYTSHFISGTVTHTLVGCVINGNVYGDTSFPIEPPITIPPSYSFRLYENYPNPFNPITKIGYEIPALRKVNLSVYDMLGRFIAEIVNEEQSAGYHEYTFDGSILESGVYVYRLVADSRVIDSRRMVLLK